MIILGLPCVRQQADIRYQASWSLGGTCGRTGSRPCLVQVGAPVGRHPAVRARDRLTGGVAIRRDQIGAGLVKLVALVTPEPGLPRPEAADDRVPGGRRVRARVL